MWVWVCPLLLTFPPCGCQGFNSGHWAWAIWLVHWLLFKNRTTEDWASAYPSKGFINNGQISYTKLGTLHCPYPWPILPRLIQRNLWNSKEMAFWGSVWTNEVDLVQSSSERIYFKSRAIVKEETKQHSVSIFTQAWCFNHRVRSVAKQ